MFYLVQNYYVFYNSRQAALVIRISFDEKKHELRIIFVIAPSINKSANPGDKGVFDFNQQIMFVMNETEFFKLMMNLDKMFTGKLSEFKIDNHFSSDRRVSKFGIKLSEDKKYLSLSLYSNKKVKEGQHYSVSLSKDEQVRLYGALKSIANNFSILKMEGFKIHRLQRKNKGGGI